MSIFRWPEEHTGQTSWSGTGEREHFAQFYDDESVLLESVAGFVQNGIETGAAIVLVVTEAHRATLGRRWRSLGLDTAALRERGQFVVLDAAQTLARIMDGDRPDRARLFELAHGFLAPMAGRHGRIAIFGEMVTLLWKAGRYEAAIELDGLWNELVAPYSLSLCLPAPGLRFERPAGASQAVVRFAHAHRARGGSHGSDGRRRKDAGGRLPAAAGGIARTGAARPSKDRAHPRAS